MTEAELVGLLVGAFAAGITLGVFFIISRGR